MQSLLYENKSTRAIWSTLEYIPVQLYIVMQSISSFLWVHFEFNLEAERTDPSQKRSIKFSVSLLQPANAFVSNMSILTNSP